MAASTYSKQISNISLESLPCPCDAVFVCIVIYLPGIQKFDAATNCRSAHRQSAQLAMEVTVVGKELLMTILASCSIENESF